MKDKNTVKVESLGFFGALTILFIALKLLGYISWSWWWVLSPLWFPPIILLGLFAAIVLGLFVVDSVKGKGQKNGK